MRRCAIAPPCARPAATRCNRSRATSRRKPDGCEIVSRARRCRSRVRNPFAFAPREIRTAPPQTTRPPAIAPAAPAAVVAPVPALTLIGIAEEPSPEGLHRTAMIAGADDTLYMVMEGQAVAERYRVTAIGADAVQLEDLLTGAVRRLALR